MLGVLAREGVNPRRLDNLQRIVVEGVDVVVGRTDNLRTLEDGRKHELVTHRHDEVLGNFIDGVTERVGLALRKQDDVLDSGL